MRGAGPACGGRISLPTRGVRTGAVIVGIGAGVAILIFNRRLGRGITAYWRRQPLAQVQPPYRRGHASMIAIGLFWLLFATAGVRAKCARRSLIQPRTAVV